MSGACPRDWKVCHRGYCSREMRCAEDAAAEVPVRQPDPAQGEAVAVDLRDVYQQACNLADWANAAGTPMEDQPGMYAAAVKLRDTVGKATHALRWGATAPAPARAPLTDEQMLACVRSIGTPIPMGLTRDRGPYEVTEPAWFLIQLVRAIEGAHGIGAEPPAPFPRHHENGADPVRERLVQALDGLLQVYGGAKDFDGLSKSTTELDLIASARAALAEAEGSGQ